MAVLRTVDVPEGRAGDWRVERFEVDRMGASIHNAREPRRPIRPGVYTMLKRGGVIVMSDTPAEMRDHIEAVARARGHVLVNGLGLGMAVQAMLDKPDVTRLTVVELSEDVISLVAPHYQTRYGDRLEVVHASAFEYVPQAERYGAVWHDIWDYITEENLPQMRQLRRKYSRRADWQGCWAEAECKEYRRRWAS